jgi:hypothetical protein
MMMSLKERMMRQLSQETRDPQRKLDTMSQTEFMMRMSGHIEQMFKEADEKLCTHVHRIGE